MALAGRGVLAIWNGIAPEAEADFAAWHVREHIPERVGLPGFLRGRRYVSDDAQPRYFNYYETVDTGALTSEAYRARLNAPSAWTSRVVRHFTDTSRTVCRVADSRGLGEGGWVATFRLFGPFAEAFGTAAAGALEALLEQPGVVAAHLLEGEDQASRGGSAEKAMRAQPDEVVGWILLVEGIDRQALDAVVHDFKLDARLQEAGAEGVVKSGIYRLQYALSHAEMMSEAEAR